MKEHVRDSKILIRIGLFVLVLAALVCNVQAGTHYINSTAMPDATCAGREI